MGRPMFSKAEKRLPESAPCVVYALLEPITHEPFYVGSASNLATRYSAHLSEAKRTDGGHMGQEKNDRIRRIVSRGMSPGVIVLDSAESQHVKAAETNWMNYHTEHGITLANCHLYKRSHEQQLRLAGVNAELHALLKVAAVRLEQLGDSALSEVLKESLANASSPEPRKRPATAATVTGLRNHP